MSDQYTSKFTRIKNNLDERTSGVASRIQLLLNKSNYLLDTSKNRWKMERNSKASVPLLKWKRLTLKDMVEKKKLVVRLFFNIHFSYDTIISQFAWLKNYIYVLFGEHKFCAFVAFQY